MSFADELRKPYASEANHARENLCVTQVLSAIKGKCLDAHRANKRHICGYISRDSEFGFCTIVDYRSKWIIHDTNFDYTYSINRIKSGIRELGFSNFKAELHSKDVVAKHENYFFGLFSRPIYEKEYALFIQIEW